MMFFPKMLYTMRKAERQITAFRGLNLSENTKEGELADAYGITTAHYPCITQRERRVAAEGYANVSDVFEWDGKLVTISDNFLHYGKVMDNVEPGKKQFAVLNSQIVVWPDMICIDTTDGSYRYLGGSLTTIDSAESAVFTTNTLAVTANPVIRKNIGTGRYSCSGLRKSDEVADTLVDVVYTYGKDTEAVKVCWNAEAKAWDTDKLNALRTVKSIGEVTAKYETIPALEAGDIFIPEMYDRGSATSSSYVIVTGETTANLRISDEADQALLPDTSKYNTAGFYGVFQSQSSGEFGVRGTEYEYWYYRQVSWIYNIYNAEIANAPLSNLFGAGDYVDISGTKNGTNDKEHLQILAVDDETNTLTFADGSFTASSDTVVTITVPFPELSYICEKGNRLWGVSNKDNTVYVSALGKPNDFYSYDTEDSYAVALGSDGDFTAICAYGDSVLCWKEDILHKFYGDMPSNYRCTDVKIAGVQKGSERSLAVIDEKLYYKGTFGVYVYSGGLPQKISYNLGDRLLTDAVGGGHGDRYYLSVLDAGGEAHLFVYDITHGLWMQEDKLYADALARVGTALYMLSDGILYEIGAGDEKVPWMAEFVPFDETAHNRKGYTMLRLRLDMGEGAWLKVEVREDRGQWRTVHTQSATSAMTLNIPLRIGRCDRFAVRLSGKGECVIRSVEREFLIGSKR